MHRDTDHPITELATHFSRLPELKLRTEICCSWRQLLSFLRRFRSLEKLSVPPPWRLPIASDLSISMTVSPVKHVFDTFVLQQLTRSCPSLKEVTFYRVMSCPRELSEEGSKKHMLDQLSEQHLATVAHGVADMTKS